MEIFDTYIINSYFRKIDISQKWTSSHVFGAVKRVIVMGFLNCYILIMGGNVKNTRSVASRLRGAHVSSE